MRIDEIKTKELVADFLSMDPFYTVKELSDKYHISEVAIYDKLYKKFNKELVRAWICWKRGESKKDGMHV